MTTRIRTGLAAFAVLATASGSALADDAAVAAGKLFFDNRCRICHDPAPGSQSYGPPLAGVFNRQAGTVAGFPYSEALMNSGIVWTEASLKAWMSDNDGMLPGTRMRHVGVSDVAEQDMIVAYLKSLGEE